MGTARKFRKISKKIFNKGLALLPKAKRHELFRTMLKRSDTTAHPSIRLKVAETQDELEQAFKILHDSYIDEGFMTPQPSGMRITVYHALPSTSTLIVLEDEKVIGTVSIIRDSPLGFPLDKVFDTSALKKNGARLAEISSLAIRKEYRGVKGAVLFPLLKYLYDYCVHYFGVDYFVIAVNPNKIEFYESILFFKRLTDKNVEKYDFVNGNPAVGAYLNLRYVKTKFIQHAAPEHAKANFFDFMESTLPSNYKFPDRKYFKISDPVMTATMLDYFFNEKTEIFSTLTDTEKAILWAIYNDPEYRRILPPSNTPPPDFLSRKESRFEVGCKGRIVFTNGTRVVSMRIVDVSMNGFRAVVSDKIRFGTDMLIRVAIGDFEIAEVIAFPVWDNREENLYGFKIMSKSENWEQFIETLSKDLLQDRLRVSRSTSAA